MSVYDKPGDEGDYKVWYAPQLPMTAFEVPAPDLKTARLILETLERFSLFEYEHRVKPDYSDMGGVICFEDGKWSDVEDVEQEK